jgi:hypothetical protein
LCSEVKSISTPSLDGSKINQANCVNAVRNSSGRGTSAPGPGLSDDQLGVMMKKLGYTDENLIQAQAGPSTVDDSFNPVQLDSSLYHLYQSVRMTPGFLIKVENLPSYNEPTSTVNRAPNYNEFLYKTAGVDLNKPELCGRISPNALVDYPNMASNYDNSLRDECYQSVAVHYLNPAVCDQMTSKAATTPYSVQVNGKYSTEMLNNVEGCKYEVVNNVAGVKVSSTPPDESYDGGGVDFAKVLGQLGYEVSPTAGNSPNYYGWNDYLRDLEFTPDFANQKNEFITKVDNFQCQ